MPVLPRRLVVRFPNYCHQPLVQCVARGSLARARFDPVHYANSLFVTHVSDTGRAGSMGRQTVAFRVIDLFYDSLLD